MVEITAEMHNWVIDHVMGSCTWGNSNARLEFNKEFNIPSGNVDIFEIALTEAEVFECANCGWYCEFAEMSDKHCESVCQDCADEDDE